MERNHLKVRDKNDHIILKHLITIGNVKFIYRQAFVLAVFNIFS
jgi:hypothetical protein